MTRISVPVDTPREDGKGGELGWIIYMGESGDPEAELKAMVKKHPAAEGGQTQPAAAASKQ
jgi:hypothetical protein